MFGDDAAALFASADQITNEHCWPLFGNANHQFIDWHRDPFSGYEWPLDFHGDIKLQRNDGSDVRAVWELNRLGHLLTLARAYSLNSDRRFSAEFFRQVESWDSRNPVGYGVNWSCAMEVALRAINLLGAFAVFRRAADFDSEKLAQLLRIFDQHGRFIREHLEFSYIATSNHYLSNVAGLLWLGIMLPELEDAAAWRAFGLRELQREMDKQILPDGADYESSTGYHRLVLELFCYSFLLCRLNGIEIEERYWQKLHRMFAYVRAYLRPDGYAPLLGDSDSGQVFPLSHHRGDDHGYLLALGAVLFDDAQLKDDKLAIPTELLWLLWRGRCCKIPDVKGRDWRDLTTISRRGCLHFARRRSLFVVQRQRCWSQRPRFSWTQRCFEHRSVSMRQSFHRRSRHIRLYRRSSTSGICFVLRRIIPQWRSTD